MTTIIFCKTIVVMMQSYAKLVVLLFVGSLWSSYADDGSGDYENMQPITTTDLGVVRAAYFVNLETQKGVASFYLLTSINSASVKVDEIGRKYYYCLRLTMFAAIDLKNYTMNCEARVKDSRHPYERPNMEINYLQCDGIDYVNPTKNINVFKPWVPVEA